MHRWSFALAMVAAAVSVAMVLSDVSAYRYFSGAAWLLIALGYFIRIADDSSREHMRNTWSLLVLMLDGAEWTGAAVKEALALPPWRSPYRLLHGLEDNGLVVSREQEGSATRERAGIARRLYRITEMGRSVALRHERSAA